MHVTHERSPPPPPEAACCRPSARTSGKGNRGDSDYQRLPGCEGGVERGPQRSFRAEQAPRLTLQWCLLASRLCRNSQSGQRPGGASCTRAPSLCTLTAGQAFS